ncbi:hypothetical protein AAFF_G00316970 [Aldrovandia affinis]|uniref:Pyrin domain-containing protein n=1 Tax=Aldrovandia affinis TaxID=143900 RepID=A0AAD7R9R6_9TELE|nr:hypothetical protein AAFF_G00316970 [Aldrovandia affinis]
MYEAEFTERFRALQLKIVDIGPRELEDTSRAGVVTLMKRSYPGDKMMNITRAILKKIQRNDLVERLEDGLEKSVEARGRQMVRKLQQELTLSSGPAGSDVSPRKKHRDMEPGSETEQEGTQSRSKAASPLSSSHQGPDTGNEKHAQRVQEPEIQTEEGV